MIVSSLPIWTVDVGGSLLMIVFSFLCVYYAMELRQGDPQNIVWTYLLWVSIALAIFAISRSLGHIVKQLLIITHRQSIWEQLRPYSGAINSLAFMVVGAVTLFSSAPGPSTSPSSGIAGPCKKPIKSCST
jgi:two-component system NtrC family sensor kinase